MTGFAIMQQDNNASIGNGIYLVRRERQEKKREDKKSKIGEKPAKQSGRK